MWPYIHMALQCRHVYGHIYIYIYIYIYTRPNLSLRSDSKFVMHKADLDQGRLAAKRRVNNSAFFDLLWPSLTFFGRFCSILPRPRPMLTYFATPKFDFAVFCNAQGRFGCILQRPKPNLPYFATPKAEFAVLCYAQGQICRILPRPRPNLPHFATPKAKFAAFCHTQGRMCRIL